MKKFFLVLASIVFTVCIFVTPTMADSVYMADIVKCGTPNTPAGCGSNPAATDPLTEGKVMIHEDGAVKIDLIGAASKTTYRVFVGNWVVNNGFQFQFTGTSLGGSIGTVKTNTKGSFHGSIKTDAGEEFIFPPGITIGQLNFAFNNPELTETQFTTGIIVEPE